MVSWRAVTSWQMETRCCPASTSRDCTSKLSLAFLSCSWSSCCCACGCAACAEPVGCARRAASRSRACSSSIKS
eukprot:1247546-Rhodomonas_salina.1